MKNPLRNSVKESLSLNDYEPYLVLKTKHDALRSKLGEIFGDETPDQLRSKATTAETKAVILEAEAFVDESLAGQAAQAFEEARTLRQQADAKERMGRGFEMAIAQIKPQLDAAKAEAAEMISKAIRAKHEQLVPKIIKAMTELNELLEQETELDIKLRHEVGASFYIVPIYRMTADKFGQIRPGAKDCYNSELALIIRTLQRYNYDV